MTRFSKPRLDRAISVGLAHPISRFLDRHARIPILMYHGVSDALGEKHPYFETNTSPSLFARQMRYLHENGYRTLDLTQAVSALSAGSCEGKPVVITFDDGLRDFYTDAFPVLMTYGFKATMFVVTEASGEQRISRDGKQCMTWDEIREVRNNGISIGSHTVTHPELHSLLPAQVRYEVETSKRAIEDKLGDPVQSFSYPYAFPEQRKTFVSELRQLLDGYGYKNGVSTIIGTAGPHHDRFFLPRLPINSHDDLRLFRAKLEGGYDWLHAPQLLYKSVRAKRTSGNEPAHAGSY
jgi:peptidoglycan/xylan/chitin deacetylase (PgdA/CDA1 family)